MRTTPTGDPPMTPYRLRDLVVRGSLDRPLECLLVASVRAAFNIVISGPPDSGKTTMLNALSACIPPGERRDRSVVGDVGRSDALPLLNAMARGPGGALAAVRATSPDGALPALAALAGAASPTASTRLAETTAGHAVDLIVHLAHAGDGTRRVGEVALPVLRGRCCGLATLACYEAEPDRGRFRHYPLSARLAHRLRACGEPIPAAFCSDRFGSAGG